MAVWRYSGQMKNLIKRTFRITKENDRNLKKWAKSQKVSESEIVRRALLITSSRPN